MDDTDKLGRLQALERQIEKLWSAIDELMRDQVEIERRLERLEKGRLKPKAMESTE